MTRDEMEYDQQQARAYAAHLQRMRDKITRINETYSRESLQYRKPSGDLVLEGYAVLYDVPHLHKSRTEVFAKGCFNGTLNGVMFFVDHDLRKKKLGDTDDGNLELHDSDIGLAFRLKLAPGDLDRLAGRDAMSCMYKENTVEDRKICGETFRIIKRATLVEISAVYNPAIKRTHASIRNADSVGTLPDDVARNFASEAASHRFMRALRALQ